MKILLINPPVREWAKPNCFPLGLGYIASVLIEGGHDVEVLDLNVFRIEESALRHSLKVYKEEGVEIVGLTAIVTQYAQVKKIAEIIREVMEDVFILCGGPLASSCPKLICSKTQVDVCIRGEGEKVISYLNYQMPPSGEIFNDYGAYFFKYYRTSKHAVPYGMSVTSSIIDDVDGISFPSYDLFPIEEYIKNPIAAQNINKWEDGSASGKVERSMNIIGSRGCPYKCVYCYHNYIGQGYRLRSPKHIVAEMEYLKNKYNVEYIHFVDDAFAIGKAFVSEFCDLVERLGMKWSCAGRADAVGQDEEIIKKMADSGCIGLCYGLETASPKMLETINKRITVEQYRKAVSLNQKYFPDYQDYTFMVNLPWEEDEDVQLSIDFCKEMGIVPTAVFYMTCYPGTPFWKRMVFVEKKAPIDNVSWLEKYILKLGEQGEGMLWSDMLWWSDYSPEKIEERHKKFMEETGAWNKKKH